MTEEKPKKKRGRKKKASAVVDLPAIEERLAEARTKAEQVLQWLNAQAITDMESLQTHMNVIKGAREERAEFAEARKGDTDPLALALQKVNALYQPILELYDAIDDLAAARVRAAGGEVEPRPSDESPSLSFEITDPGAIPPELLTLDEATARRWVEHYRSQNGSDPTIPGVRVVR